MANCYWQSLRLAEQMGLESIAFPAISCGVFGYPPGQAATIAVRTLRAAQPMENSPHTILLCCFGDTVANAVRAALLAD